jgi:DNA-binding beta-propeller fold protein YncE
VRERDSPEGVGTRAAGPRRASSPGSVRRSGRIQKFTTSGAYLTEWGNSGSGDGQFQFPREVAVDGSGNVYVVDQQNNRIQIGTIRALSGGKVQPPNSDVRRIFAFR